MSTRNLFQLTCISLILSFTAWIAAADPFTGVIEALTDDGVDHLNLVASGGNAAWQSPDPNGFSQIFLYLGNSGDVLQLTDNDANDINPVIAGSYVAWEGWDGNDWEIFVYNGDSVTRITDNELDDVNPKISASSLFWDGFDGTDWEVYKTTLPRPPVKVGLRFTPRTLNQKSNGKWISCVLSLPNGILVKDVNKSTILLEGEVSPDQFKAINRQTQISMKFLRNEVIQVLDAGNTVNVELTAYLKDGTKIKATDTIRVIH